MNMRHKGIESNKLFFTMKPWDKLESKQKSSYLKMGLNKNYRAEKDIGSSVSSWGSVPRPQIQSRNSSTSVQRKQDIGFKRIKSKAWSTVFHDLESTYNSNSLN